MPSIWRAYEFGYPPGPAELQSLGILTGFEAVMPDVFWYGNWGVSNGNGWADAYWIADVATGIGSDSAAMVKWYQRNVCPGDTLSLVTYYGIGQFSETVLFLNHTPPVLTANCDGTISPNPFPVNALVINGGSSNACNVTVSISLPSGLTVASGTHPDVVGTLAGMGGTSVTTWGIQVDPSVYGTTQSYTITVTYDNCSGTTNTISTTYTIVIPMPSNIFTSVTADDTLLCLGESTRLHLSYGDGTPPYSFTWYATSGYIDPYSLDPVVSPFVTTTYYAYVIDAAGCVGRDKVTIFMSSPVANAGLDQAICLGGSEYIGGFPTAWGGIEPYRYTWTPATGLSDPTASNPIASPSLSTTYYLSIIDTAGCVAFDTVNVLVSALNATAGREYHTM
jgi:hypothetical protein